MRDVAPTASEPLCPTCPRPRRRPAGLWHPPGQARPLRPATRRRMSSSAPGLRGQRAGWKWGRSPPAGSHAGLAGASWSRGPGRALCTWLLKSRETGHRVLGRCVWTGPVLKELRGAGQIRAAGATGVGQRQPKTPSGPGRWKSRPRPTLGAIFMPQSTEKRQAFW
ncbi:uncharacterized protein LOC129403682 [Sorex araneus]|uniref:uncharacterized protein LOC129403682 n=1 Tax=Sorex araneus TaxID=42254 RepID=UPI002433370A|nr:uncharacterized protein LOC129403682 [Sorex araneus]